MNPGAKPGTSADPASAPGPTPFRSPVQFLAFGFGSGLSPRAPGTMGTLVAVPIYCAIAYWNLAWYSIFVVIAALLGIWICGAASRELQVHDHPGIVWDEIAGYLLTMLAAPAGWVWIIAGFALFRLFDIWKPWPIGWLDRHVRGGVGIMLDDLAAGALAAICLHLVAAYV